MTGRAREAVAAEAAIVAAALLAGCGGGGARPPDGGALRVVDDLELSARLLPLLSDREDNWTVSPLGILECGAMLCEGARGETRTELERALGYSSSGYRPRSVLLDSTAAGSASGLWIAAGADVKDEYRETLRRGFDAEARPLSRQAVEAWAAEKTAGLIRGSFPELDAPNGVAAVTHAAFLMGRWRHPFPRENTVDRPFHPRPGEDVPVPMMSDRLPSGYANEDRRQVLSLPFKDPRLVAVFVLPHVDSSLGELLASLSPDDLARWLDLPEQPVDVTLPQVKLLTERANVIPYLRQLGAVRAFDRDLADFSGVVDVHVWVGYFLQDTLLELDEEGVEAAAVTRARLEKLGYVQELEPQFPEFLADRPFLVLIALVEERCVLFAAAVRNPAES